MFHEDAFAADKTSLIIEYLVSHCSRKSIILNMNYEIQCKKSKGYILYSKVLDTFINWRQTLPGEMYLKNMFYLVTVHRLVQRQKIYEFAWKN